MNFRILNLYRMKNSAGKTHGNTCKKQKKSTLETTLSRSFFAVSAVLLLLSLGITMYYDITRQRKEVDSTISGLAAYIASMPQVIDMLQMGYPSDSVRKDLDSLCSNTANLNVALICDKNGLRFYHTDRNTTGETRRRPWPEAHPILPSATALSAPSAVPFTPFRMTRGLSSGM